MDLEIHVTLLVEPQFVIIKNVVVQGLIQLIYRPVQPSNQVVNSFQTLSPVLRPTLDVHTIPHREMS